VKLPHPCPKKSISIFWGGVPHDLLSNFDLFKFYFIFLSLIPKIKKGKPKRKIDSKGAVG